MTTKTRERHTGTVQEVAEVEGKYGPQWKLTAKMAWTNQYPEFFWMDQTG